jgi:hypothetical protein
MKQAAAFLFFILLIAFPKICVEGARQGLILWGFTLVPTLLPFFIATKCILRQQIPEKLLLPYLFFIGYFCGYPTGATVIYRLYRSHTFTKEQSELLICFCNHVSPAFLISFVHYTYLRNQISLFYFLAPIYLASVIWSLIFYLIYHRPNLLRSDSCQKSSAQSLEDIFMESVSSILKIGCFMILFSICIQMAFTFFSARLPLLGIFSCFLEITGGIYYLSSLSLSFPLKTALIGALCAFGGCCSIVQVQSVLEKELSIIPYIIFKLCTGITVFLFFCLMSTFLF